MRGNVMTSKVSNEKLLSPTKTFSEIKKSWEQILKLDIRSRLKAYRTIENDIKKNYSAKESSLEEIEFYLLVLRITKVTPQLFSRMFIRWLELTGNSNPTTLLSKRGKVDVESGCLHVADPSVYQALDLENYSEKKIVSLMNQGNLFELHVGGDGEFNVQLRIVDTPDPIVTAKEFKCCEESTGMSAIIQIPTGELWVADAGAIGSKKRGHVAIKTTPGNYKICAYNFHIPEKVQSIYIVLSKTEQVSKNEFSEIPVFHYT